MSNADWLLAPMEVSALVVGTDAADYAWSNLAPDYSKISRDYDLVGPALINLFPQAGSNVPGPGIHLHWFLPDAFGHVVDNAYPHIPNRWLVRRVRYARAAADAPDSGDIKDVAGWIIESDFLHKTTKEKGEDGTISIPDLSRDSLFDSVGKVIPLQAWTETNPAYRFKLTAFGSGTPNFASHYPACRSILGFYDSDIVTDDGSFDVSYVVTGWCSDQQQDLLHGVTAETWQRKLNDLQWSIPALDGEGEHPAFSFTRVLCHGAVSRIVWNNKSAHLSCVPSGQPTLVVGNTSAEALATLLAKEMRAGKPEEASQAAPLLAAFHYDMLARADDLRDVDAEFHRHRFTSFQGGDRYSIHAKRKPVDNAAVTPADAAGPPSIQRLPDEIEAALYELNEKAGDDAVRDRELASLRQELFSAWCVWAKAYIDNSPANDALPRTAVTDGERAAAEAKAAHAAARGALEQILKTRFADLELAQSTELPFYRPADPIVLISGKGFGPQGVYDPYAKPDLLPCRPANEIVSGLSALIQDTGQQLEFSAKDDLLPLPGLVPVPIAAAGPPPDLLDALLRELLILDPADPRQQPPPPSPLAGRIVDLLKSRSTIRLSDTALDRLRQAVVALLSGSAATDVRLTSGQTGIAARRPETFALFRFSANPWRPLLLVWEVKWHPDPALAGTSNLAGTWTPWPLDEDGNEFRSTGAARPDGGASYTYQSYTLLAPHAAWVLRRRLEALGGKASEIISKIDSLEVLSQSLGGFHDALRQLRPGLQLPPINPDYVLTPAPQTAKLMDGIAPPDPQDRQHTHAPYLRVDNAFLPIRAGQFEFSKLWLVDSFGQTRRLIGGDQQCDVITSFGLPAPSQAGAPSLIPLPPRYVQPARLDFRWLSAEEDHPGGSPLCGWIFPNHLDQSLMVCDASGKLWGALQTILRVNLAGGTGGMQGQSSKAFFWVPVPGTELTPTDIPDRRLQAFVRKLLEFGADAGAAFLQTLAASRNAFAPAPEHDARLSILVGKPLALARASLQIELMGLPVRRASGGTTGAAQPDDPTRGFTRVRLPARLGGLAGYVIDGEDGTFHPRHGLTGTEFPGAMEYGHELSVDAERAIELTLLLDPVTPVEARCGVLPCHSLHLPESVVAGVSFIRDVFFQSAPLLGPPGSPRVPHPSDDYGQWSWAARPRVTYWQEYADITDPGDRGGFGQSPLELHEGWLKLAMNPVNVSAFWVKEGALKVPAGTRITLGWMSEGAETLTLADPEEELASWSKEANENLPEEYRIEVSKNVRLSLTASDSRGNRSVKSLQLEVT